MKSRILKAVPPKARQPTALHRLRDQDASTTSPLHTDEAPEAVMQRTTTASGGHRFEAIKVYPDRQHAGLPSLANHQADRRSRISIKRNPKPQSIQRYVEKTASDGKQWRVSESGKSALQISQDEGGQTMFASPDLIKQANLALTKAGKNGSFIRLAVTSTRLKKGLLKSVSGNLRAVKPRLVTIGADPDNKKLRAINLGLRADDDGTKSKEFALWADCGRSSRAVMGTDDSGNMPEAEVRIAGKKTTLGPSADPARFSRIYRDALPIFLKRRASRKYLQRGIHYTVTGKKRSLRTPLTDQDAKKMYWALGAGGRRAFDSYTGINRAANPTIGGGYTLATEYDMPGFKTKGPMTWNFHWAGVVMKDGANNITLENYAVSYGTDPDPIKNARLQEKAYNEVNREWVFQMYGTRKRGQTFHEQHVKSGTHGTRGSTFAVKVK